MTAPLAQRQRELRQIMIQRKQMREKNFPSFMASTQAALPSTTHRFFVENHTDNETVIQDLHKIENLVDTLGKKKKR